jgi:serine/threonine-protein kinase
MAELAEGTVIDGKYRVRRRLAEGGMGQVFIADHVFLQKQVALKVLHPNMSAEPDAVERFSVEARAASLIEHENVVRVSDFGRSADGQLYLVMELLSGHTLSDELQRGPVAPARARFIACAVLRGLEAAHARGVVHRDLKPENVFITPRDGGEDLVKLLDFGIARMHQEGMDAQQRLTKEGAIMGTPLYMAPEQLRCERDVDARADLYAVGVLLYEMLSGKPPWDGKTFGVLAYQVLDGKPPPLQSPLGDVVMRAFASDRNKRYQSAAELRRALEAQPLDAVPAAYLAPRVSQLADLPLSSTAQARPQVTPRERPGPRRIVPTELPPLGDMAVLELDRTTPAPSAPPPAARPRRGVTLALTILGIAGMLGAFAAARTLIARATPSPAPAEVTIRVLDLPHNANVHVFLDGAPVGTTFTMPGDREHHRLRLAAFGYADKALLFVPDANQSIDGRMNRSAQ